jgi:hypothetical protein
MEEAAGSWILRFSRFSGEFRSFILLYSHLEGVCQEPGLKISGGNPPFSVEESTGRARCAAVPTQKTAQNGDFHWGSLGVSPLHAAPGSPASTKNPRLLRFMTREFGSLGSAPGAQPGNLSRGYPQSYTHRGVWEFHRNSPCVSSFPQV